MPVTYITEDGNLAMPDSSEGPLHTLQQKLEEKIDTQVRGVTGMDNQIRRVIVDDDLSDAERREIEDWLNASLVIEDEQT